MGTPRERVMSQVIGDGTYTHYRVGRALGRYSKVVLRSIDEVVLDVGIDGFQLAKSSKRFG